MITITPTPDAGADEVPPPPDPSCAAKLWHHASWWYVVETHDCALFHGWLLISHHPTEDEAQQAADARYPRPHG